MLADIGVAPHIIVPLAGGGQANGGTYSKQGDADTAPRTYVDASFGGAFAQKDEVHAIRISGGVLEKQRVVLSGGVKEVQSITLSGGTAEVQKVSVTGGVREVQRIKTRASANDLGGTWSVLWGHVNEVQKIKVSAAAANLGGTFTVAYGAAKTGDFNPKTMGASTQLASDISALAGVGDVTVTAVAANNGFEFTVKFDGIANSGDLPMLAVDGAKLTGSSPALAATEVTKGIVGKSTASLSATITAAELKAALEALAAIGEMTVFAKSRDYGQEYEITFDGLVNKGDIVELQVRTASLTGSSASITVVTLTAGVSSGGVWTLSYGGQTTTALSAGDSTMASAATVEAALEALAPLDDVSVSAAPIVSGSAYTITMADVRNRGDVAGFSYDKSKMCTDSGGSSCSPNIAVQEVAKGVAIGGSVSLEFDSQSVGAVSATSTDAQLKAKLESLSTTGTVSVARSYPSILLTRYDVTFDGLVNRGDILMLTVPGATAKLTGASAAAAVSERTKGVALAGTFTLDLSGASTADLAATISAADLAAALNALSTVGKQVIGAAPVVAAYLPAGAKVSKSEGALTTTYDITFDGLGNRGDVPLLTGDKAKLTGGSGAPALSASELTKGVRLTGTFKASLGGQSTPALNSMSGALVLQTQLTLLSTVQSATVTSKLVPHGNEYTITFGGTAYGFQQAPGELAYSGKNFGDVAMLAVDKAKLAGGTPVVTLSEQRKGYATDSASVINDVYSANVLSTTRAKLEMRGALSDQRAVVRVECGAACATTKQTLLDKTRLATVGGVWVSAATITKTSATAFVTEQQTVTTSSSADDLGGTFKLSFGGQTTAALAKDASNTDVQAALNALSSVTGAAVAASSKTSNGYVYTVTFGGAANYGNVGAIGCDKALLTGSSAACAVADNSRAAAGPKYEVSLSGDFSGSDQDFVNSDLAAALRLADRSGVSVKGKTAEQQTVTVGGGVREQQVVKVFFGAADAGGFWKLGFGGGATANIKALATAAELKAALEALPAVGSVSVTSPAGRQNHGNEYTVTFDGVKNTGDVPLLAVADTSLLTAGGHTPPGVTTAEVTKGVQMSGSYTLSFGGQTTGDLTLPLAGSPKVVTLATVASEAAAALSALSSVGTVSCAATAIAHGAAITVTFDGAKNKGDVAALTGSSAKLSGDRATAPPTVTVVETVKGAQHQANGAGAAGYVALIDCAVAGCPATIASDVAKYAAFSSLGTDAGASVGGGGKQQIRLDRSPSGQARLAMVGGAWLSATSLLDQRAREVQSVTTSAGAEFDKDAKGIPTGSWALSFGGKSSGALSLTIDDVELKAKLEALPTIGKVDVTRSAFAVNFGFTYTISFAKDDDPLTLGNVAALICDTAKATSAASDVKEVQTVTTSAGADNLGGTFTLGFGGQTTAALAKDASNTDVQAALNALSSVTGASVARGAKMATNGYAFAVTFDNKVNVGDVALLTCGKASLTGTSTACAVAEQTKGVAPVICAVNELVGGMQKQKLTLTSAFGPGYDRFGRPFAAPSAAQLKAAVAPSLGVAAAALSLVGLISTASAALEIDCMGAAYALACSKLAAAYSAAIVAAPVVELAAPVQPAKYIELITVGKLASILSQNHAQIPRAVAAALAVPESTVAMREGVFADRFPSPTLRSAALVRSASGAGGKLPGVVLTVTCGAGCPAMAALFDRSVALASAGQVPVTAVAVLPSPTVLTVNADLIVRKPATMLGIAATALSVSGKSTLADDVTIGTGKANLAGQALNTLKVDAAIKATQGLSVNGDIRFADKLGAPLLTVSGATKRTHVRGPMTIDGLISADGGIEFGNTIKANFIAEKNAGKGVNIEGVQIAGGGIKFSKADKIEELYPGYGVSIEGVILKDKVLQIQAGRPGVDPRGSFDGITVTNTGHHKSQMENTKSAIAFRQFYDHTDGKSHAAVEAGRLSVGTVSDWTEAAATHDSYAVIETVEDGVLVERIKATQDGVFMSGLVVGGPAATGARALSLQSLDGPSALSVKAGAAATLALTTGGSAQAATISLGATGGKTFSLTKLNSVFTVDASTDSGASIILKAGSGTKEAQTVTTSATSGDTSGQFKLSFGGQTTASIAWNANAAAVQTALNALSTVGTATIAASAKASGGYVWTVTFDGSTNAGDVAALSCVKVGTGSTLGGSGAACLITETTKGVLAGKFRVGTDRLVVDARTGDTVVQGKLDVKGDLVLNKNIIGSTNSRRFRLFDGKATADLELLSEGSSALSLAYDASCASKACKSKLVLSGGGKAYTVAQRGSLLELASADTAEVQLVTTGAASGDTSGTFKLSCRGQTTAAIGWAASAAFVKAKLEALSTVGTVQVAVGAKQSGGYGWTVTFDGLVNVGDLPPMGCDKASLGGTSAACSVSEKTKGSADGAISMVPGRAARFTVGADSELFSVHGASGDTRVRGSLDVGASREMQRVELSASAGLAGTFTLTLCDKQEPTPLCKTTAQLAKDASAAALLAALNKLCFTKYCLDLAPAAVTRFALSGPGGGVGWEVTFDARTNAGGDASKDTMAALSSVSGLSPGVDFDVAEMSCGTERLTATGVKEVQTVTTSATSGDTSGQFKLRYRGQTTGSLAWNVDAVTLTAAFNALSTVGTATVARGAKASGGYGWAITFDGSTNAGDAELLACVSSGGGSTLGGTGAACAAAETTKGVPLSVSCVVTEVTEGVAPTVADVGLATAGGGRRLRLGSVDGAATVTLTSGSGGKSSTLELAQQGGSRFALEKSGDALSLDASGTAGSSLTLKAHAGSGSLALSAASLSAVAPTALALESGAVLLKTGSLKQEAGGAAGFELTSVGAAVVAEVHTVTTSAEAPGLSGSFRLFVGGRQEVQRVRLTATGT